VFAGEVLKDDIGHRADPSPEGRVVEEIHDGPGRVGDRHPDSLAPDEDGAEKLLLTPDPEAVAGALDLLVSTADPASGDDEDGAEELLGEAQVLAGGPAADVAGIEGPDGDHPGILDPLPGGRVSRGTVT
jgi:hypothetical protein